VLQHALVSLTSARLNRSKKLEDAKAKLAGAENRLAEEQSKRDNLLSTFQSALVATTSTQGARPSASDLSRQAAGKSADALIREAAALIDRHKKEISK
jgi:hypothetical protein